MSSVYQPKSKELARVRVVSTENFMQYPAELGERK